MPVGETELPEDVPLDVHDGVVDFRVLEEDELLLWDDLGAEPERALPQVGDEVIDYETAFLIDPGAEVGAADVPALVVEVLRVEERVEGRVVGRLAVLDRAVARDLCHDAVEPEVLTRDIEVPDPPFLEAEAPDFWLEEALRVRRGEIKLGVYRVKLPDDDVAFEEGLAVNLGVDLLSAEHAADPEAVDGYFPWVHRVVGDVLDAHGEAHCLAEKLGEGLFPLLAPEIKRQDRCEDDGG